MKRRGIMFQASPPYTPSQNGPAERSGGVIIQRARDIALESGFPLDLWPEFIGHAVRIINRLPIQRENWTTPYQIVFGRQADLSTFREIGSKAYVLIQAKNRQALKLHKMASKAVEGWLVGMQASNIYQVWVPQINRVIVSRDVRVDEGIKFTHEDARNSIPIPQSRIITILEQDLDEDEIEELVKEAEQERQLEIIEDDDVTPALIKNPHTGLPTPPPSIPRTSTTPTPSTPITSSSSPSSSFLP